MTIIKRTISLAGLLCVLTGCGGGGDGAVALQTREPASAPALPATEVANAAPDTPLSDQEAYRLLEQGTFGPRIEDIQLASGQSPESWINQQMQLPAIYLSDGLHNADSERWNEYVNVWWRQAIQADDQLRQRVAFALSQILVVSAHDGLGDEQFGLANYYDILLRNAFGNYRDLLSEVTRNPLMGEYLSMKGNRKPDLAENIQPDENYAREILQLFSIGQVLLNEDGTPQTDAEGVPLPAYDQTTIENFARVFTGWHFANAEDFRWPKNKDYLSPMEPWSEYHDTDAKTLLGGVELAAGQSAEADLNAALDNIFNHPNVGPFISKQLIQRLVTSNPSDGYVRDVTAVFNQNAIGERGSLGSVIKAILMHTEARQGHLQEPDTFGKMKEPLIRMTQLWRAFEPETIHYNFNYGWAGHELRQAPLGSPSVFNFFRPDFSQPGEIRSNGLVSPEFEILDESSVITITSRLLASILWSHNFKNDADSERMIIDISREMDLEPDIDALLDHLDLLLLGGRMSFELRAEVEYLMSERSYDGAASQRVVEAIFLIATSPEAAVQR
ncbi:DUF1800 domain-containing protein [Granulosicoccus antarcticus]|uniref:DUF1800 domain-containing protein n=1 Tax=Granulosicoccus antarcticus IMCC3135 TaxID=1192854 RepID=A0A2Z2NYU9_9GAMM|nr:DUF1800 family protein [Granulosicoccus antarcticus]ASJ76493.1 hypothetical protein IMCC3135_32240 [Granulosicoccus antarcticus IMCC3135]